MTPCTSIEMTQARSSQDGPTNGYSRLAKRSRLIQTLGVRKDMTMKRCMTLIGVLVVCISLARAEEKAETFDKRDKLSPAMVQGEWLLDEERCREYFEKKWQENRKLLGEERWKKMLEDAVARMRGMKHIFDRDGTYQVVTPTLPHMNNPRMQEAIRKARKLGTWRIENNIIHVKKTDRTLRFIITDGLLMMLSNEEGQRNQVVENSAFKKKTKEKKNTQPKAEPDKQ